MARLDSNRTAGAQGSPPSTFKDWAGQPIAYRLRPTRVDEDVESGLWMTCEVDPHDVGEWHVMGRGRTGESALKAAVAAWNDYDRRP